MSDVAQVKLRSHHDERVASGHPWVFSNEISDDVSKLVPGAMVDVMDAKGKFLGRGYANPRSLIAIRILSRRRKEDLDHVVFYEDRLRRALSLREAVYPGRQSMRVVFGESDGLPGLVVDRYGDVLSVQITTLGMEVRKPLLAEALQNVFAPVGVVLRNEAKVRELEGLKLEREVWFGEVPDVVHFDEFGVKFSTQPLGGQKTGHFFDQLDNKRWAAPICVGRTVLDVYANTGGWALHALAAGATHATVIDSDADNCARALANADANGFGGKLDAIAAEAKLTLQGLVARGRRFGAVVVDPPAFAKQRKAAGAALHGYREINALGMTLVEDGGFLFTSSCSYHVEEARFLDAVMKAARDCGRRAVEVHRGQQASDHPVLSNVPETRYLKSFAFRVTTDA